MTRSRFSEVLPSLALMLCAFQALGQVTFTNLFSFDGTNGSRPKSGLVLASDGNFYGTTTAGGQGLGGGNGVIYRMNPVGDITKMHVFSGGVDGRAPATCLIQGHDGHLHGTAFTGGQFNYGTVFRITLSGAFTTLATFDGTNGAYPSTTLVQDNEGNLFGTTVNGQPSYMGNIFRMGTNKLLAGLAVFDGTNGAYPQGKLVLTSDGFLYGATPVGGSNTNENPDGHGTVVKLSADGQFTVLVSFDGTNGSFGRALIEDSEGGFLGACLRGGPSGHGTIYKLTTNGVLTPLAFFDGTNGSGPLELVIGSDENYYGTTLWGGQYGHGTIFQVTPVGILTTLFSFDGTNGSSPRCMLVEGEGGSFYGTTEYGGAYARGTIFRLTVPMTPVFRSITHGPNGTTLAWNTLQGRSYQLQYTTNLNSSIWTNLGDSMIASNTVAEVNDVGPSSSERYYRVKLLP